MKVISNVGCTRCLQTKKLLKAKGVSFDEVMIEDLSQEEQEFYKAAAREAGMLQFPIIVDNQNKVISVVEALAVKEISVVKRDGKTVPFDNNRIVNAINAAISETDILDDKLASIISKEIEEELSKKTEPTSVEEIQDMVESKLMSSDRKDVAKKYILYRENRFSERSKTAPSSSKKQLLTDEFINQYKHKKAPFTEFGEFVYLRTYSRFLENLNRREHWYETVRRAVEYNCSLLPTSREEAEELFDNIFNLRQFLSGRTFWTAGTEASKLYPMSNFNCAFIIVDNFEAYEDIFYASMVGTGIGFRILKSDVEKLPKVRTNIKLINEQYESIPKEKRKEHTSIEFDKNICTVTIGDSKEGWTDALNYCLKIFHSPRYRAVDTIVVNYNNIRPYGEKLMTFGGTASGHESMRNMITKIHRTITKNSNGEVKKLRPIDAMDIANIIAENVVSGGVRRSAQICLFDADDKEVLEAKSKLYIQDESGNWSVDKEISHRQMSNNSIFYNQKPSKEQIHWQIEQMRYNGEPAFINGEAIRERREDGNGVNPCGEILLNNKGMCNLTTVNLLAFVEDGVLNKEKLYRAQELSARAGYRMANIELELHDWNEVLKRDKLVGCSFTGLQDMINSTGMSEKEEIEVYKGMREAVHNAVKEYGESVGRIVPKLMTTIKPEGTLSCLPTVSSGVHYPHSEYFIRRVRISSSAPLCKVCEELGYPMFPEVGQDLETAKTMVVEFPIASDCKGNANTKFTVTAIQQLENYKRTMEYYTDHNTSITVSVREHEWEAVEEWMFENWNSVVGISFLPLSDAVYPLAPFEEISKEEYTKRKNAMKKFDPNLLKKYESGTLEDLVAVDSECASGACGIR